VPPKGNSQKCVNETRQKGLTSDRHRAGVLFIVLVIALVGKAFTFVKLKKFDGEK